MIKRKRDDKMISIRKKGARNRIENIKKYVKEDNINADFYIATEECIFLFL